MVGSTIYLWNVLRGIDFLQQQKKAQNVTKSTMELSTDNDQHVEHTMQLIYLVNRCSQKKSYYSSNIIIKQIANGQPTLSHMQFCFQVYNLILFSTVFLH